MATINLLPWREELREQRKKQFINLCFGVVVLGITTVFGGWFYFDHKLDDQEQANQLIKSTNQNLDQQLKALNGLQEQRDAIIERMKLIQNLQSQRPVVVRLVDELVRVTPPAMYLTKFSRVGDKFTIEGKAESPNTVAELLRNLESSPWYRNAFMNSFLANEDKKDKTASSLLPRVEDNYGSFVVTVDLGEMGVTTTNNDADKPAVAKDTGGSQMSQDELQELSLEQSASKKKKFNLDKFLQQFNTLDMNNYGSWPISVKITCWIFIFFAVLALGYFVAIQPKLQAIDNAQAQEGNLLNEFREKDSKLRNLQQYQVQLQEMQANFNQQLEQLPKETEIPSLVEDINLTGVNSGLKFKNIRLEDEVKQEIFIEQPIAIEATGDYHAFGAFVSSISALPRIVTMHDFVVEAAPAKDSKSDIPVLNYSIKAKTYRYIGAPEPSAQPAKAAAANAPTSPNAQPK